MFNTNFISLLVPLESAAYEFSLDGYHSFRVDQVSLDSNRMVSFQDALSYFFVGDFLQHSTRLLSALFPQSPFDS